MPTSDLFIVLQWWFTIFALGIGFLPITFLVFDKFNDSGYIFSKIFGIAFTTYAVFLLGVLRILPFTKLSTYLISITLALIGYLFLRKYVNVLTIFKQKWKIFLFEEIFFLLALFAWSYIHAFNPDIHGLEKYMDFGFINSILRSDYFPPKDMWFTPFTINYYYFGHMATAVLTRLSNLPSFLTFNLMLSSIFAFCFMESFSLGANLFSLFIKTGKLRSIKLAISGLLTASLVTFAGNLHIFYAFFKAYEAESPVPFWQLPFLPLSFPNSYWYPNATRFIYNTIHEFPIYSWVVADLHGHVLDIPFVLLTIAILLAFFTKSEAKKHPEIRSKELLLIGFLLAVMYMTNAWDGGIYLLLALAVVFYKTHQKLSIFFRSAFVVSVGMAVFTLPYSIFFKPFASGIGILCAPEFLTKIGKIGPFLFETNYCQHSPWWQLLTLYGFFCIFIISFGILAWRTKKLLQTDIFVFFLIILSTFLIILPEFIYLKDIYPAHYRANTMFKLVFQSFIMLSLSSGYIIIRIISNFKFQISNFKTRLFTLCFLLFALVLISLVLTYPYLSIKPYYNDLKLYKGLNGINYLKELYPTDFEAIQWINKNVKGQPVILEAQGDSYTDHARVSSNTGLPTILGWTVHEWLWRGDYSIPAPRIADVKTLYETADLNDTKKLIKKYNVQYVFVGVLEYQKYPTLSDVKFGKIGKVIFNRGRTKIYKISLLNQ